MAIQKVDHGDNHEGGPRQVCHPIVNVLIGAMMLTWPALLSGYPLLYPDSMTYLSDGPIVARAVFLHRYSGYYGIRSLIYSMGIFPFHWNISPWPIIFLQSLITAWVIWLVIRACLPKATFPCYFFFMICLSALTSVSWFASAVLPDCLGPVLYLCIFLLVFAPQTLSNAEEWLAFCVAWWAISSHVTHLMVGTALCLLLCALLPFPFMRGRKRGVCSALQLVGLAMASQFALNAFLYGKPSLNGERPPFLMARVIADGPGRLYLKRNCGVVRLAVCAYVDNLPDTADEFLWDDSGVWQSATSETNRNLQKEEMPFVLAVLKQYPREELFESGRSFWNQLITFDLNVFDPPGDWTLMQLDAVLPLDRPIYLKSKQANSLLPEDLFSLVQSWAVAISLGIIALSAPRLWLRGSPCLWGLYLIVLFTVVVNALVTGPLSVVENRFQARVIWLIPCLAGVAGILWGYQFNSYGRKQGTIRSGMHSPAVTT